MADSVQNPPVGDSGQPMRQQILDSAGRCFVRFGLKRTSMPEIADEAGVSRRTVYNYFGSKQDLLTAFIVREVQQSAAKASGRIDRSLPPNEVLVDALFAITEWRRSPIGRLFVSYDTLEITTVAADQNLLVEQMIRDFWIGVLKPLRDRGYLKPDADLSDMAKWLDFQTFAFAVRGERLGSDQEIRRFLLRYWATGLLK